MATATQTDDVLQDKSFLELQPPDQKAYLSDIDPSYKALKPEDQDAYYHEVIAPAVRQHVLKTNAPSGNPPTDSRVVSTLKSGALGLASGFTGAPETENSLYDMAIRPGEEAAEHPLVNAAKQATWGPISTIGAMAKNAYGAGKEMLHGAGYQKPSDLFFGPSAAEVNPEEIAHGAGSAIGQIGQAALGLQEGGQTVGQRPSLKTKVMDPGVPTGLSPEATRNLRGNEPAPGTFTSYETPYRAGTTGPAEARIGAEDLFKGAGPTGANPNFREKLAIALPDLAQIQRENPISVSKVGEKGAKGGVITPDMRIRQTIDNIRNFQDKLWNEQREPQIARNEDVATMGRSELGLGPDELKAIESRLGRQIPEHMNLREADTLLHDVNAFRVKMNRLGPEARAQVTATTPILDNFDQMHDRLIDRIGQKLEGAGEPGVQDFNRRYAALSAVREAIDRRMNTSEANSLLDNVQVRAGLRGPGLLERLHVKPSPGRQIQTGLEALGGTGAAPEAGFTGSRVGAREGSGIPAHPNPPPMSEQFRGVTPRDRPGATAPNLPGHFDLGAQTPFGQQQPVGDLWAGPPAHWIPGIGEEGPSFPPRPEPARPAPGVNLWTDPRVVENMRAAEAARQPGTAPPNAAGATEVPRPVVPEESRTILPGREGTAFAGQLPERVPPPPPNTPPAVEPQFAKEATGTVQDPRLVGEQGEAGTRGPVLIRRTAPIPTRPRGVYQPGIEGPIGTVGESVPRGANGPSEIFGGNVEAERAAVEPEIMARESRQADIRRRAMKDAADAFESQQAGPVINMTPPERALPPGTLADRFNAPAPPAPTQGPIGAIEAPAPRLKGGINPKGFEESTRPSSPRDVAASLETENADLRRRAAGADDAGKATINERIRQNDERIAELKGTAGAEQGPPGYTLKNEGGFTWAVDPTGKYRISLTGNESPAEINRLMADQIEKQAQLQRDLFGGGPPKPAGRP